MSTRAREQQPNKIVLPARTLFAVLLVLAVWIGIFALLTMMGSSEPTVIPFGEPINTAENLDNTTETEDEEATATNAESEPEVATAVIELPIKEEYSHLYPNEARIATFLQSKGLDDLHIAAIIGVFKRESGNGDYDIEPAAVEDNLIGHGIAQWSFERWAGAHYNRPWQGLKYYAQDYDRNWEDLDIQLEYLWAEMTGEGPATDYVYIQYDHEGFMATTSLEEAVSFYLAEFMNCGGAQYDDRLDFAYALYEKIE